LTLNDHAPRPRGADTTRRRAAHLPGAEIPGNGPELVKVKLTSGMSLVVGRTIAEKNRPSRFFPRDFSPTQTLDARVETLL
jgi:hypothetical protein